MAETARLLPLTAWAITTGEAGMRTQARGLAAAAVEHVVEKRVALRWPQSWFQAGWPGLLSGVDASAGDTLEPPWPDLIVTCGRRAAIIGVAVKQASGGRAALVHVQDPLAPIRHFDLIVAMAHDDRIAGPKVLKTLTTMHDVTPARLDAAARDWTKRLERLPRPLTGLILGGPTRSLPFGLPEAKELEQRVAALRAASGGGLAVVGSRRTPPEVLAYFAERTAGDPGAWTWDGTGDNPYLGVLAFAERLVVTGDSVSMVSEALATDHPVEVFADSLRKRHASFVETLVRERMIGLLAHGEEAPPHPRLDATRDAGEAVRRMLIAKGKA